MNSIEEEKEKLENIIRATEGEILKHGKIRASKSKAEYMRDLRQILREARKDLAYLARMRKIKEYTDRELGLEHGDIQTEEDEGIKYL